MRRRRRARQRGFTLMEVLLVMAILVVLGSLVVLNFTNIFGGAKVKQAKIQLTAFKQGMGVYFMDMGNYPTTQEGLASLVTAPPSAAGTNNWTGPYLDGGALPKDPWGQDYQYSLSVSSNGVSQQVTIFSMGPDMQQNTDDDISITFGG